MFSSGAAIDSFILLFTAFSVMENILKMYSPIMPFITEELYHEINPSSGSLIFDYFKVVITVLVPEKFVKNYSGLHDFIMLLTYNGNIYSFEFVPL